MLLSILGNPLSLGRKVLLSHNRSLSYSRFHSAAFDTTLEPVNYTSEDSLN